MLARPPMIQPKRQHFVPQPRGSLVALEAKPSDFHVVAPESPRPPEMMTGVRVNGSGSLSAFDLALHEILISHAYEIDRKMQAPEYSVSMKAVVRFLGEDARRDQVVKSLEKLRKITLDFDSDDKSRRYEAVPMITPWREVEKTNQRICYSFPSPIRSLMRSMPSYTYVELAALADGAMTSKFSPALYKHLALQSTRKTWQLGGDNEVFVQLSPVQIAEIIQFPGHVDGSINVGKLKDFLTRTMADLSAVRRFTAKVEFVEDKGRGRALRYVNFTLTLQPPPSTATWVRYESGSLTKGMDDPRFMCRSDTWLKVERKFSHIIGFGTHKMVFELWLIALQEALDKRPLTSGYDHRQYRGDRLLKAIDDIGPVEAAWRFFSEEAEEGDLTIWRNNNLTRSGHKVLEAQIARYRRIGKSPRRIERLLGILKAAENRKRNEANEITARLEREAQEFAAGKIERAAFDIVDMPAWQFEQSVIALLNRKWTGERTVLVRLSCGDERISRKITPTYQEYQQLLQKLQPFQKGEQA